MSLARCRVVLVETQFPGNLGAVARAMRNFGLDDLVLVSPQCDPLDPNARQLSTQGEEILRTARMVPTLEEALADCVLAAATSARTGGLFRRQPLAPPREGMPHLANALRSKQRTALVFGSERTGLTNEQISLCQHLIHIPTSSDYAALNLAQAAAICLYELHLAWLRKDENERVLEEWESPAPLAEQDHMFRRLRAALEKVHFLYGDKADPLMHALRHLLGKARLSVMEVKLLLGLARQIIWYVDNHPG